MNIVSLIGRSLCQEGDDQLFIGKTFVMDGSFCRSITSLIRWDVKSNSVLRYDRDRTEVVFKNAMLYKSEFSFCYDRIYNLQIIITYETIASKILPFFPRELQWLHKGIRDQRYVLNIANRLQLRTPEDYSVRFDNKAMEQYVLKPILPFLWKAYSRKKPKLLTLVTYIDENLHTECPNVIFKTDFKVSRVINRSKLECHCKGDVYIKNQCWCIFLSTNDIATISSKFVNLLSDTPRLSYTTIDAATDGTHLKALNYRLHVLLPEYVTYLKSECKFWFKLLQN